MAGGPCSAENELQTKSTIDWLNTWPVIVALLMIIIVTLITTLYLFICKRHSERPDFVMWQMLFLNLYWILFVSSLFDIVFQDSESASEQTQTIFETLATMADVCILIHDWIFIDAYLVVSMRLPIVFMEVKYPREKKD